LKGVQTILYPGNQREWELWSAGGRGASAPLKTAPHAGDLVSGLGPTVVALPAESCRTLSFSFPVAEDDLVEGLIQTQLERRGLHRGEIRGGGRRVETLLREAGRTVVSVDLVEKLDAEICFPSATDYLAAARLHEYPAGKLVVFPQHGRLVMAAGLRGQLAHCHAFSHSLDLPPEASQEIMLTALTLQNSGVISDINGIELWGEFSAEDEAGLAAKTGLPVTRKQLGNPNPRALIGQSAPLLPESVREAKRSKSRVRKIILGALLGLLAYAAIAYFLWDQNKRAETRLAELKNHESELAPQAAAVRASIAKWQAFQPVLDHRRYPIVILSELTKVLPPSGVMIREYDTPNAKSVDVEGRAKDTRSAHQFLEDVQASEELALFNWTMGAPKVQTDKTAVFLVKGKLIE